MKKYTADMIIINQEPAKPSRMAGFVRKGLVFVLKNGCIILIQQIFERIL